LFLGLVFRREGTLVRSQMACRAGAAIGCVIFLVAGCGDGSDDSHSGGADSHEPPPPADVKCPDNFPEFTATMDGGLEADQVTHESLRVRVTSANEIPPRKGAENDWTVQFMDRDAKPLDDVELVAVCTHMPPPHNHYSHQLGELTPQKQPGSFAIGFLNFTMEGVWEVQLLTNRAGAANAGADDADASVEAAPQEFTFCDKPKKHPGSELSTFRVCVLDY
jgi:hypothetical protein